MGAVLPEASKAPMQESNLREQGKAFRSAMSSGPVEQMRGPGAADRVGPLEGGRMVVPSESRGRGGMKGRVDAESVSKAARSSSGVTCPALMFQPGGCPFAMIDWPEGDWAS
jgi:hypothetical protein